MSFVRHFDVRNFKTFTVHVYFNFQVSYSILEDKNNAYKHFDIDSQTGIITTRSTFDREEEDKAVYYIKVKAVDGTKSDAPGHFPPDTPNSGT